MNIIYEGLTFDDVLLVPLKSSIASRKNIDVSTMLTKKIALNVPILSAPMDTVTESSLCIALGRCGGLGIIHRFLNIEDQCKEVLKVKEASIENRVAINGYVPLLDSDKRLMCSAAVGLKDTLQRIEALLKVNCDVICMDIANGHSDAMVAALRSIKKEFDVPLIAGNVCTADGVEDLAAAGADSIKVGIGPGSTCITRLVAGCGVPQLTAIEKCSAAAKNHGITIIADGGMRSSGDFTKAIAAGASAGMFGGLLAGAKESPSQLIVKDGKKFKKARGMASLNASMQRLSVEGKRYSTFEEAAPEGAEIDIEYKGEVADVIHKLVSGLRSGMSYCNSTSIEQLHKNARFVKTSASTRNESAPHNDFYL